MAKTTTPNAEVRVTKMDQARDLYRQIVAKPAPKATPTAASSWNAPRRRSA